MLKGYEVGDAIPDFALPDQNGVRQTLSALQGPDPMILILGRGEHCIRERLFHRDMCQVYEWISVARFSQMVSILPGETDGPLRMAHTSGARWPILHDEDSIVQRTFDIPDDVLVVEPPARYHPNATVPHVLILGPNLKLEKLYVGSWFWGRPTSHELFVDIRDLNVKYRSNWDPTPTAVSS